MAQGGVYDQLAGGFHRYSVDERWIVPHFEKMSYDNSELLKNYVHGYQVFGHEFYAHVARDIVRWMDEWLSDREHGGFYASQDADINLDDDGDYFTWTVEEAKAVLSEDEFTAAALHYDINEVGEMQHNSAKNVLWVRALPEEIAARMGIDVAKVLDLLASAKTKLYAARLKRPTPFVDKTVYVNWNAMCVSAYLQAAQVLGLEDARKFALRSLDRILAEAWNGERGLSHVIAYADEKAEKRFVRGLLDDYAFTVLACLDAFEVTGDMSYFKFAQQIADEMIRRFGDPTSGGFFDTEASLGREAEAGCSLGAAQAISGCTHSGGESQCGDCLAAPARLHQRGKVPRESRGHAGGFRRRSRAVWNLCRNLWYRGDMVVEAAYTGCGGRRRRASTVAAEGRHCSVRGEQVSHSSDGQRSRDAEPTARAGGDRP